MVRWISPSLGTGAFNKVKPTEGQAVLDVRHLVDKAGNASTEILNLVEQGCNLLKSGQKLVVCCDYGMSRSNSIAAGILARSQGVSFVRAAKQVAEATGETEIKFEMLCAVAQALGEGPQPNANRKPKVLITGATGDLGSVISKQLADFDVLGISSQDIDLLQGTQNFGMFCLQHQPTHILHLASPRIISTNRGVGDEITMLKNVADVALQLGVHLIYPSSAQVFAGLAADETLWVDEQTPTQPAGYQGYAKYFGEQLVLGYGNHHNLNITILRLPQIYGFGLDKPRFIKYFADRIHNSAEISLHFFQNGKPVVELLYISDLVQAIKGVITHNATGIFHVGSNQPVSPEDIARAINSHADIRFQQMPGMGQKVALQSNKLNHALSFKPVVSLQDGIHKLLEEN